MKIVKKVKEFLYPTVFSLTPLEEPKKSICTVANLITFFGIVSIFLCFYFITVDKMSLGFIFFLFAIFSDLVDGSVARYIEAKNPGCGISRVGEILDPIRDKMIILVILFFNAPLAFCVFLAEIFSIIMAAIARKKSHDHIVTFTSKMVTGFQFPLISMLFFWNFDFLFIIILLLSVCRGMSYSNELYKFGVLKGV